MTIPYWDWIDPAATQRDDVAIRHDWGAHHAW